MQAIAIFLGMVLFAVLSSIDVEIFSTYWYLILLFNLGSIGLLLTPLGVDDGTGNKAWLYASWMPTSIQPAELVKVTYTVLLADQVARRKDKTDGKATTLLFLSGCHAAGMFLYIYAISGDAGSGLVYISIFVGIMFAAGISWYWFLLGLGGAGACLIALAFTGKIPQYMVNRMMVIIDRSFSPEGVGWQQGRSVMAIGSGGVFGQGFLQGIQTQSPYSESLPARHTDLIFSVCGEELGMVGCLGIMLLEFLIVLRCFAAAGIAKSSMERYICVGFGTMIMVQTVENIGMCLFVMPVIGLTLPFFSYGGSSIITMFMAMGIVSGIQKRILPNWLRT